jgi:hypothetical protein
MGTASFSIHTIPGPSAYLKRLVNLVDQLWLRPEFQRLVLSYEGEKIEEPREHEIDTPYPRWLGPRETNVAIRKIIIAIAKRSQRPLDSRAWTFGAMEMIRRIGAVSAKSLLAALTS